MGDEVNGWPRMVDVFVRGNKEGLWEKGEQLGLKDDAIQMFRFAAYEVRLTLAVQASGEAEIVAVDGRALGGPAGAEQWVELEFFREQTKVGLAQEVEVLGRPWLRFRELHRDGTFAPARDWAERKLFGRRTLTEDEARREALGIPWGEACGAAMVEPSAVPGLCRKCANDRAAHERVAAKNVSRERACDIVEAICRLLTIADWSLHVSWTAAFDDPARRTFFGGRAGGGMVPASDAQIRDVHVGNQRISREQWETLAGAMSPTIILSWDKAAATWDAPASQSEDGAADEPESDGDDIPFDGADQQPPP